MKIITFGYINFILMRQKFSVVVFFFSFCLLHSCYTMSHPEPCPGLVEQDFNFETELCVDLTL